MSSTDQRGPHVVIVGGGFSGCACAEDRLGVQRRPPGPGHGIGTQLLRCPRRSTITLVDHGDIVLGPFSDRAHAYARKVLVNKGVRLMLGASVTEVGPHHHELHGSIAFSAWLGVHAWLLSTTRARIDA